MVDLANWAKRRNGITVLVAIDVTNLFNTLSWNVVLRGVDVRGIQKKLLTLLENYFMHRRIVFRS